MAVKLNGIGAKCLSSRGVIWIMNKGIKSAGESGIGQWKCSDVFDEKLFTVL